MGKPPPSKNWRHNVRQHRLANVRYITRNVPLSMSENDIHKHSAMAKKIEKDAYRTCASSEEYYKQINDFVSANAPPVEIPPPEGAESTSPTDSPDDVEENSEEPPPTDSEEPASEGKANPAPENKESRERETGTENGKETTANANASKSTPTAAVASSEVADTGVGTSKTIAGTTGAKTNPANTKTTPANTKTTPANTKTTPANTKSIPANTKTTPASTKSTPANTKSTPANTKTTPVNTKTTPANTKTTPVNTKTAPPNTKVTPSNPKPKPASTKTTPPGTSTKTTPAINTKTTPANTKTTPPSTSTKTTPATANTTTSKTASGKSDAGASKSTQGKTSTKPTPANAVTAKTTPAKTGAPAGTAKEKPTAGNGVTSKNAQVKTGTESTGSGKTSVASTEEQANTSTSTSAPESTPTNTTTSTPAASGNPTPAKADSSKCVPVPIPTCAGISPSTPENTRSFQLTPESTVVFQLPPENMGAFQPTRETTGIFITPALLLQLVAAPSFCFELHPSPPPIACGPFYFGFAREMNTPTTEGVGGGGVESEHSEGRAFTVAEINEICGVPNTPLETPASTTTTTGTTTATAKTSGEKRSKIDETKAESSVLTPMASSFREKTRDLFGISVSPVRTPPPSPEITKRKIRNPAFSDAPKSGIYLPFYLPPVLVEGSSCAQGETGGVDGEREKKEVEKSGVESERISKEGESKAQSDEMASPSKQGAVFVGSGEGGKGVGKSGVENGRILVGGARESVGREREEGSNEATGREEKTKTPSEGEKQKTDSVANPHEGIAPSTETGKTQTETKLPSPNKQKEREGNPSQGTSTEAESGEKEGDETSENAGVNKKQEQEMAREIDKEVVQVRKEPFSAFSESEIAQLRSPAMNKIFQREETTKKESELVGKERKERNAKGKEKERKEREENEGGVVMERETVHGEVKGGKEEEEKTKTGNEGRGEGEVGMGEKIGREEEKEESRSDVKGEEDVSEDEGAQGKETRVEEKGEQTGAIEEGVCENEEEGRNDGGGIGAGSMEKNEVVGKANGDESNTTEKTSYALWPKEELREKMSMGKGEMKEGVAGEGKVGSVEMMRTEKEIGNMKVDGKKMSEFEEGGKEVGEGKENEKERSEGKEREKGMNNLTEGETEKGEVKGGDCGSDEIKEDERERNEANAGEKATDDLSKGEKQMVDRRGSEKGGSGVSEGEKEKGGSEESGKEMSELEEGEEEKSGEKEGGKKEDEKKEGAKEKSEVKEGAKNEGEKGEEGEKKEGAKGKSEVKEGDKEEGEKKEGEKEVSEKRHGEKKGDVKKEWANDVNEVERGIATVDVALCGSPDSHSLPHTKSSVGEQTESNQRLDLGGAYESLIASIEDPFIRADVSNIVPILAIKDQPLTPKSIKQALATTLLDVKALINVFSPEIVTIPGPTPGLKEKAEARYEHMIGWLEGGGRDRLDAYLTLRHLHFFSDPPPMGVETAVTDTAGSVPAHLWGVVRKYASDAFRLIYPMSMLANMAPAVDERALVLGPKQPPSTSHPIIPRVVSALFFGLPPRTEPAPTPNNATTFSATRTLPTTTTTTTAPIATAAQEITFKPVSPTLASILEEEKFKDAVMGDLDSALGCLEDHATWLGGRAVHVVSDTETPDALTYQIIFNRAPGDTSTPPSSRMIVSPGAIRALAFAMGHLETVFASCKGNEVLIVLRRFILMVAFAVIEFADPLTLPPNSFLTTAPTPAPAPAAPTTPTTETDVTTPTPAAPTTRATETDVTTPTPAVPTTPTTETDVTTPTPAAPTTPTTDTDITTPANDATAFQPTQQRTIGSLEEDLALIEWILTSRHNASGRILSEYYTHIQATMGPEGWDRFCGRLETLVSNTNSMTMCAALLKTLPTAEFVGYVHSLALSVWELALPWRLLAHVARGGSFSFRHGPMRSILPPAIESDSISSNQNTGGGLCKFTEVDEDGALENEVEKTEVEVVVPGESLPRDGDVQGHFRPESVERPGMNTVTTKREEKDVRKDVGKIDKAKESDREESGTCATPEVDAGGVGGKEKTELLVVGPTLSGSVSNIGRTHEGGKSMKTGGGGIQLQAATGGTELTFKSDERRGVENERAGGTDTDFANMIASEYRQAQSHAKGKYGQEHQTPTTCIFASPTRGQSDNKEREAAWKPISDKLLQEPPFQYELPSSALLKKLPAPKPYGTQFAPDKLVEEGVYEYVSRFLADAKIDKGPLAARLKSVMAARAKKEGGGAAKAAEGV